MEISKIPTGQSPPHDLNAFIQIALDGGPVRYEFDSQVKALFVSRFFEMSEQHLAGCGFVPNTLAANGRPIDIVVAMPFLVAPRTVVRCRPIGALIMDNDNRYNEVLIAVPIDALRPRLSYLRVQSYRDLPDVLVGRITEFFGSGGTRSHGRSAPRRKWVGYEEACSLAMIAINRHELKACCR